MLIKSLLSAVDLTSNQEHTQKWAKDIECGHSNYDDDEIVRHSNLASAAYGIGRLIYTPYTFANELENKNKFDSRFNETDEELYLDVVQSLTCEAKKIHSLMVQHDFNTKISGELLRYKNA